MRRSRHPVDLVLRLPSLVAQGLVRLYQLFISPFLHLLAGPGSGCKFTPSCSEYARIALRDHGFMRGSWLAARRLLRCHPWQVGGLDPVPPGRDSPSPPPGG